MGAAANRSSVIAIAGPVDTAGAVIWWHLSGTITGESLLHAWTAAGFDPELLPPPPSPKSALRRALRGLETKTRFARPLDDGRWALVAQGADAADKATFDVLLEVGLDDEERVDISPVSGKTQPELTAALEANYALHRAELSTEDVSNWLVRRAALLKAVPLRESGGLYFVPAPNLPRWHAEAQALRTCSGHTLCEIPAMRSEEAVSAILDAVQREAESEAMAMEEELSGGLGNRAITTRISRTEAVEAKVSLYEGLLGSSLETLRSRLSLLRANLSAALLSGDEL